MNNDFLWNLFSVERQKIFLLSTLIIYNCVLWDHYHPPFNFHSWFYIWPHGEDICLQTLLLLFKCANGRNTRPFLPTGSGWHINDNRWRQRYLPYSKRGVMIKNTKIRLVNRYISGLQISFRRFHMIRINVKYHDFSFLQTKILNQELKIKIMWRCSFN